MSLDKAAVECISTRRRLTATVILQVTVSLNVVFLNNYCRPNWIKKLFCGLFWFMTD